MDPRLIVLAVGMFALGTDSYVMAGVLPQIAVNYGVSIAAAGQMTTVYCAVGGNGRLQRRHGARLADRRRRRRRR
ncbi:MULTISPECIES: hypothetical protein [unclassified Duganella]|uniref:hypothetical protein n=1 Tax=unclassified Duganella TaxID=2636909 RepID=UPI001E2D7C16|nr:MULTISPECIES: hypothetical protein [unclassified Duganella]